MANEQQNKTTKGFASKDEDTSVSEGFAENSISLEELVLEDVEFKDFQGKLPWGIPYDNKRLDTYSMKPFKTKYDRALGQLLKRQRNKLVPVLAKFLPQLIEDIGGYGIEDLAQKTGKGSGENLIKSMPLGDVLTLLVGARVAANNYDVAISVDCPNCGTRNEDKGTIAAPFHRIDTINVKCLPQHLKTNYPNKINISVPLPDGLEAFSEKSNSLYFQPLRLHHAEQIGKAENTEAEDITMIYQMVSHVPLKGYRNVRGNPFNDELYDELTLNDLAAIRKAMRVIQPGPEMSVAMECFACGHEWEEGVAWGRLREFLFVTPEAEDE